MTKKLLKDIFLWGVGLWLIGYILGIVLFAFIPPSLLGWVITPIGTVITLWVLFKKIKTYSLSQYLLLGLGWVLIATVLDYFLLVQVFKPADGYYKLDVYLYYLLTLLLPLIVGLYKKSKRI